MEYIVIRYIVIKIIDTPEHKNLVARLIQARLDAGLTQKEAADQLGKSQSFISKIEAGHSHIDVINFYKMTRIYEIKDLDKIFEFM
jgi:transcriptional regulator with XRE-family HTH domain